MLGFALVARLLGEDAGPEGMPDRCSRPLHARVAEDRRTLEAPVHPGWLAAACGDRGDARLCLPCGGRGRAVALLAEGDEEAGGPDRPSAWEGLAEGKGGRRWACGAMAVSTSARAGTVTRRWATRAWPRRALGVLTPASRVRGVGRWDGLETMGDARCSTHVMVTEAGFEGGAAGELHGVEGWPAAENVAEDGGVFLLQPVQHVRERVLQGPGEAVGDPDGVADHAAAGCDAWGERPHRRALWCEGVQRSRVGEQPCELACGVRRGIVRPARGEGFAVPSQGEGMDGEKDQKVIMAQGRDKRAFVECKADGNGLPVEPRAQRADPRVDGLWRVLEDKASSFAGASSL